MAKPKTVSLASWALSALVAASGCNGVITGGEGAGGGATDEGGADLDECAGGTPGAAPLRRLTRAEYNDTVADLLGDDTRPADSFPPEEEIHGFDNNAEILTVSPLLAEKYLAAAEALAKAATDTQQELDALVGCDPDDAGAAACARHFLETFGTRAARRPLSGDEIEAYLGLWDWDSGDFATGIELQIAALLQSPDFLYRVELDGEPMGDGVYKLGDWEVASRLSYFLWGTMPDDELFAAAEAGELSTPEQIESQARRMLASPRARDMVARFHEQWLRLGDVEEAQKDAAVYADYDPQIAALQAREARAFVEHVVFDGDGDLAALLAAPYTFVNDRLARYYGLPEPGSTELVQVPTEPERAGVLGQGAFLAVLAKPNQSDPIQRGVFVREGLLCQSLADPPDDLMVTVPDPDPDATTRERFAQHSADPACSGCHTLIDPIGFGFEHFDGVGRFRAEEFGLPVDASGALSSTDVDGAFYGVTELADKLAASGEVRDCVATQWFRFAYGRVESGDDACTLADVQQRFADSGGNIQELIVGLTQTDAFLYRTGEMQ